jgi:hypothetical protein
VERNQREADQTLEDENDEEADGKEEEEEDDKSKV